MDTLGDRFWSIIDETLGPDMDAQVESLGNTLVKLSRDELLAFAADFPRAVAAAYRWELLGPAYVINGGCSDDGFTDFRSWLIAQGKMVYDAALADPDSLASQITEPFAEFEDFGSVVMDVFEAVHDEDWPPSTVTHPAEPAGAPWEEESLGALFPKLSAKVAELDAM